MMIDIRTYFLAMAIVGLGAMPVWAQTDPATTMDHGEMDHGEMDHGEMDHGEMDHGEMDHGSQPAPQQEMDSMDHGDMNMQGGAAPPDARDPHAWSGGYTLDTGPYVLPGPRILRLSDEHNFGGLLIDRLERSYTSDGNGTAYDAQAWFGRDYDRAVLKAEGEANGDKLQESRNELLWGHAVASYWDAQLGVRHDGGEGASRNWLAFGIQGLAPYWFEIDAAAYVGDGGRTALRLGAEYELLITQKFVLQPSVEFNLYGKRDPARNIGSGLSDGAAGLRFRYEFTRQFAPYAGIEWAGKFGETADLARATGEHTRETRRVAGVRFWF
jgi:copper resistance protein B